MPSISESDIIAEVDALVEEFGTNHLAKCMYFDHLLMYADDDLRAMRVIPVEEAAGVEPVCIVGHLIKRLEPENWIKMVNGGICGTSLQDLPYEGITLKLVEASGMSEALANLQAEQDRGETWGNARNKFKRELGVS